MIFIYNQDLRELLHVLFIELEVILDIWESLEITMPLSWLVKTACCEIACLFPKRILSTKYEKHEDS